LFRAGHKQASWLDALVEVCTRSLHTLDARSRRDLFRVYVHLDTEGGWVHKGPALPPALLNSIMCDGVVQPVWTTGGLPVNVGRRQHIVPLHTRRLVENRDRMCRKPTCSSTYGLEVHHIVHWGPPHDGRTDTENLVCLCRRDHVAHHKGEFTIEGNADDPGGLVFRDRFGNIIKPHGRPAPPGDTKPPEPAEPYQHPTGERCDYRWLSFSPPPSPARSSNSDSDVAGQGDPMREAARQQLDPDPDAATVTDQGGHDPPATETAA